MNFELKNNFNDVQVGQVLTRMLAGKLAMKVVAGKIDETYIYTSSEDGIISLEEGWKFRKSNGAEVDEDLGWDGINNTGSFLVK